MANNINITVTAIDQTKGAISSIKGNLTGLGGQLKDIGGSIVGAGAKITAATAPLALFGASSIKAAADAEQFRVALNTMVGEDAAGKLATQIQDFAATTPFQLEQIQSSTRALLAFGVGVDDIEPSLKNIGDIASGVGINIGDLSEIFGKARTQGTLFAEDINQLTGRGIPIIAEFAEQFGVTEAEVKKLGSEGKITFANLERAFQDLTSEGGQFFNLMEDQSGTAAGQFSNFQDQVTQLKVEIGKELIPIGLKLLDSLKGLVEWFSNLDGKTKSTIVRIGLFAVVLGPILIVIGGIISAIGTLATIIGVIASPIALVVGGVALLVAGFVKFLDIIGLLEPIINNFKMTFESIRKSWEDVKTAFADPRVQDAMQRLRDAFDRLKEAFAPIKEALQDIFGPGFLNGESFISVEKSVQELVFALELLAGFLEFVATVITAVNEKVHEWAAVLQNVIENTQTFGDTINFVFGGIRMKIEEVVNAINAKIIAWVDGMLIKFEEFRMSIIGKFESIRMAIVDKVNAFIQATLGKVEEFRSFIQLKFGEIITFLQGISLVQIGIQIVQGFLDGVRTAWQNVVAFVRNKIAELKAMFTDALKIASPSQVFFEFGLAVGEGFGIGMNKSVDNALSSVSKGLAAGITEIFKQTEKTITGSILGEGGFSGLFGGRRRGRDRDDDGFGRRAGGRRGRARDDDEGGFFSRFFSGQDSISSATGVATGTGISDPSPISPGVGAAASPTFLGQNVTVNIFAEPSDTTESLRDKILEVMTRELELNLT